MQMNGEHHMKSNLVLVSLDLKSIINTLKATEDQFTKEMISMLLGQIISQTSVLTGIGGTL